MSALKFILAGGVAAAALATAAPAAAQYYPGYGYPGYGGGGNVIGQVLNQVLGGGYNNYGGGYGGNSQFAVNQCMGAVQARLGGGYGGGYGAYGAGNYGYANGRVLGVSRVEQRSNGGLTVRGVASSGRYGYGNGAPDLTFKCKVDYRGAISDIDIDPAQGGYGYSNGYTNGYSPYSNDPYAAYGYRRY